MAYNVSNEYRDVIYSGDTQNKAYISFNGVELKDADEYLEKITITSRSIPNGQTYFSLGNFVAQEVDMIINDVPSTYEITGQLSLKFGTLVGASYEDVPIGVYNIQDSPTTANGKTTIKLRDNAVKFDFGYNAQPLIEENGGSATLLEVLLDMCSQAGVEYVGSTTFKGYNKNIGIYDSTIKARVYVNYIASQAGCIATCNRNGNLTFIPLNQLNVVQIPLSVIEDYNIGTQYKITRVCYEDGITKYEKPLENDSSNTNDTLFLDSANPYINTQEQIDEIYNIVKDFDINSLNITKVYGDPSIDSWDIIEIVDDENSNAVIARTLATNTLTYNGVFSQSFNNQISEYVKTTNVTKNSEQAFKKYAKTEIDNLNAQVNILAGKVVDLTSFVNGIGQITLQNCNKGVLHRLTIKNACQDFPSNSLFPSSTFYPKGSWLKVEDQQANIHRYQLPPLSLKILNGVADEMNIIDGVVTITQKIGYNEDLELYVLDTPITKTYEMEYQINLSEGTNTITLESFPESTLEAEYLTKNNYTDTFATQIDVENQIKVAEDEILIQSKTEILENGDELIASINTKSTGNVKIKASDTIALEGLVTANENFKINLDGSIETKNVYLPNGGRVIGGDGLLANLQFVGYSFDWYLKGMPDGETAWFLGYNTELTGENWANFIKASVSIPENFTVTNAYITVYHSPVNWGDSSNTTGYCRNICAYKATNIINKTIRAIYMSDYQVTNYMSYQLIENAMGEGEVGHTFKSDTGEEFISNDISKVFSSPGNYEIVIKTKDSVPSFSLSQDSNSLLGQYTGYVYMVVNVYGYMSIEEESTENEEN